MNEWSLSGYSTLQELGRGGFGRVVLARHEESGTHVAIKYLTSADETFRAEFRAEALTLLELDDPHVVRLFEYANEPRGAAIVMELVEGVSLRRLLDESGALEPEAALAILKGSLLGLGAAHGAGVVHRDYKPANVMVPDDGRSKLIDFGIALRSGAAGQIVGTPAYMAPEQWAGAPASPSTDVYAATCVFFECVTGRTPYPGRTAEAYRAQHTAGELPVEEAPEGVRELLARGLAKRPESRPPGALEFAAELETAATAAYGPEWESNGLRRLAETAAGLAALFPLAALLAHGGSGAAAAGHAVGGTAAGHAAGVGRGVLGKVLGANTAVKTAAIATGAVVVGSAGVAAVVATRHHKPKPVPLSVALAAYPRPVSGFDLRGARIVRVSGGKSPAARDKANAALTAPVEWGINAMRQEGADSNITCTTATVLGSQPVLGVRGPKLLSVQYKLPKKSCRQLDYELPYFNVNVDLRTGKALAADDVFRPETLAPAGLATLLKRISAHSTDLAHQSNCILPPLKRTDLFPAPGLTTAVKPSPPHLSPFFTPKGMTIMWSAAGSDCAFYTSTIPYSDARDLLKPELVAMLPA